MLLQNDVKCLVKKYNGKRKIKRQNTMIVFCRLFFFITFVAIFYVPFNQTNYQKL